MLYPKITKTAKALPQKIVTNDDLATFLETDDDWIFKRTGIKMRRIATTETVASLSIEVGKRLTESIDKQSIDLIIVATMSSEYSTPSVACQVQEAIGAKNAMCFDVNAACAGFIHGLSIAEKYVTHTDFSCALVIGTDVMSGLIDWTDRTTAVLFGDGSGGVLIEKKSTAPCFIGEYIQSDGQRSESLSGHLTTKDNRFRTFAHDKPYLMMNGKQIFDFALRDVSKNMIDLLERKSIKAQEIDFVFAHQANYRILEALSKKTSIPFSAFMTNVEKFGNTSAASIPILLDEAIERNELKLTGESLCLLTGYGAGLTWGSLLMKL